MDFLPLLFPPTGGIKLTAREIVIWLCGQIGRFHFLFLAPRAAYFTPVAVEYNTPVLIGGMATGLRVQVDHHRETHRLHYRCAKDGFTHLFCTPVGAGKNLDTYIEQGYTSI
jgi:hypothetical protein